MPSWTCRTVLVVLPMLVAGCGGAAMMRSPPVNLLGMWSGILGRESGGGRALRVTWTVTQDGSAASGPVSVLTSPPVTDVIFSGTLTGTISGNQVSLALSAQPLPNTDCTMSGAGTAAVAAGTIAGTLDVHFTSCGVLEPPSSDQLVLTKQ
jgi:hypothetical protein